jgi:DNA-binding MarR family transcriptional regulator
MSDTQPAAGFTRIDNRMVDYYLQLVGVAPFAVLVVLLRHADIKTGRCYPSIRRIARTTGLSQPTVLKAIAILEKEGLIKVERKFTKGGEREVNVYTLLSLGGAQAALAPVVNDVEHRAKGASAEQELINKTQENKREGPRPPPARDTDLDHPAVKAYREVLDLTPSQAQRAEIAAVVTDLATWREVLLLWESRGWWKANVDGMLDRYKKSVVEGSGGNGRNARSGRLDFQGNKAYDRRESRPPETPEERACREAEWNMLKQSQNRSQHDEA